MEANVTSWSMELPLKFEPSLHMVRLHGYGLSEIAPSSSFNAGVCEEVQAIVLEIGVRSNR